MMPTPTPQVSRAFLLAVLWITLGPRLAQGQALKPGIEAVIDRLHQSEENRVGFLQTLGGIETAKGCFLTETFWNAVDVPGGKPLSLGLFRIDRMLEEPKLRVKSEVLSMLVGEDSIWLRLGAEESQGWIKLIVKANEKLDEKDLIKPQERALLFRSCILEPPAIKTDVLIDPCKGRSDCESQLYLEPRAAPSDGKKTFELTSVRSVFERAPLGVTGVVQWMLKTKENLSESSLKGAGLSASQQLWKSQKWHSGLDQPASEHIFFPQLPGGEAKKAPSTKRNSLASIPRLTIPEQMKNNACAAKIVAPRSSAEKGDWGFTWAWKGLPNAHALELRSFTDGEGCLQATPGSDFEVVLHNRHLSVQKLQDPTRPVSVSFTGEGPYTFILPGGELFEVLLAANAFGSANKGLEGFRHIYSWLPDQVKDVRIYQLLNPEFTCSALRVPGKIYLPSVCPGHDGFVAKGLCGDVVVHELAHEVTGSLVSLATGEKEKVVEDGDVDEALANYFAVLLRSDKLGAYFAPACQNDFFEITEGNRSFNQRSFLSALLDVPEEEVPAEVVAKLVSLATLYGYTSKESFIETFFDFAEKAGLGEASLRPICASLARNAGICNHRCPEDVECLEVRKAAANHNRLTVVGTFYGTSTCPDFTILSAAGQKIFSPPKKAAPLRLDDVLADFSLPLAWKPPFSVKLQTNCPNTSQTSPREIVVSASPDLVLKRPASLEPLEIIATGSQGPGRRLVVRFDDGRLWSYAKSSDGPVMMGPTLRPGFSRTGRGSLQGWTTDGHPITTWFSPADGQWEVRPDPDNPPAAGSSEKAPSRFHRLLQEDPRVEILGIDAFEISLLVWEDREEPKVYRHAFEREIDPQSLEIGWTAQGPVLEVKGRYPEEPKTYAWRNGGLRPTKELAVFPFEKPGLSFRREGKVISLDLLKPSVCRAPPFLFFGAGRLFALTCDGVLASYSLDGPEPHPVWPKPRELGGILAPKAGARPIQLGDVDGDGEKDLILGPFRRGTNSTAEDRVEIYNLKGEPLDMLRPIKTGQEIRGAPAVLNLDHDGCDEVITATDELQLWKPKCLLPGP